MSNNELDLDKKSVRDIRNLIVADATTISPDCEIVDILKAINSDLRTRHVYVVDEENRLLGDVRMNRMVEFLFPYTAMIEKGHDVLSGKFVPFGAKTAAEIMNREPSPVTENTHLSDVARIMMREQINELPVVDDEMHVVGEVNFYEIIAAYLNEVGKGGES
ncbi:MAG: CBS domain-containing protein [Planctomycetes bacterium]|nr:CBS domain-containing protein [Planctomycetota bacterium]